MCVSMTWLGVSGRPWDLGWLKSGNGREDDDGYGYYGGDGTGQGFFGSRGGGARGAVPEEDSLQAELNSYGLGRDDARPARRKQLVPAKRR
jgi:hypothetical protein